MSLDTWKSIFEIGGVVLLAATFIFGAGALIVNNRLNAIKSRELADFKLRFEGEQQKTAHAQREAAEAKQLAGGFESNIATANQRAAEANERATKAQESLGLAEQHSAEANAKAEGFRADIAKANASAAQAEAQVADAHRAAAEANRIAESERLARLQLEARLADRVITPVQQLRITNAFAPMKGQTVDALIVGDSLEITKTANAILHSIQNAGVLLNYAHPMAAAYAQGVIVGVRPDAPNEVKQAGDLLVGILRETLAGGVGQFDFEKVQVSVTGTMGNDTGATPMGQSPIRILIAPK